MSNLLEDSHYGEYNKIQCGPAPPYLRAEGPEMSRREPQRPIGGDRFQTKGDILDERE